jgi:phospholipid transport system substrate-binding protein
MYLKLRKKIFLLMTMAAIIATAFAPTRLTTPAWANDPMSVVQTTVNQALAVLRDRSVPLSQRQDRLRQIVASSFDFTEMAKSALGYHWRKLTPEQQQEFTNTFVAFIEDSYLSKINDYSGQQVVFKGSSTDGPDYAQVNTDIVSPNKDPIHVNYRLINKKGEWKIYDVTVDAISIIANYRNQFNRVMNNQGFNALITDLKNKQAALAASLANH